MLLTHCFVVIQQMGHTFSWMGFPVKGIWCNTGNMSDPNTVRRKRCGRPRVPELPVVSFRLDPDWRQDIDDWRSGEPGNLSRTFPASDAVGRPEDESRRD